MAEALRERGVGVTLVELANQVFGAADPEMVAPVHRELRAEGVDLRLGASVTSISREDGGLQVLLSTGGTVSCGLVILAVGVQPEVGLAREAGLEIGKSGGIVVDDHMRTSAPHVYAVGDAVEVRHLVGGRRVVIPLAGPANRQGRIAADNALGRDSAYRDTQGTAICKVFDLTVGMTGLSEKALRQNAVPYEKVYVHPASHAGYYPGASQFSLKLLFDPKDGQILGAQAVGADAVDKRIDVLSTALRAGMTVDDLQHLELCYAPPYGSAKDPVNYAGFVASNVLSGDMPVCHVEQAIEPRPDQMLLDVRTLAEVEAGTIPGARHIPLDELRERLGELPADKELLVFCRVGHRGYVACRLLASHGFRCRNLTGGFKTYRDVTGMNATCKPEEIEMSHDTGETAPATAAAVAAEPLNVEIAREIDAIGLQCPGPIMRLRSRRRRDTRGPAVRIKASDPAFQQDVAAWCHSTGNRLAEVGRDNGTCLATIVKSRPAAAPAAAAAPSAAARSKTMVVFSGDLDKALASFIIANGAAAMGSKVTMFFTFWGLNVLRRAERVRVKKNIIERMFGWMMPRGANALKL